MYYNRCIKYVQLQVIFLYFSIFERHKIKISFFFVVVEFFVYKVFSAAISHARKKQYSPQRT